jgi:hypothetical protein
MKALASCTAVLPVLLVAAGFARSGAHLSAPKCLRPAMSMTMGWPATSSPRLPITLRLPGDFPRDTGGVQGYEDSLRRAGKAPANAALWRAGQEAQLSIQVLTASAPDGRLFGPEDADTLPEASTCLERIGGARAWVQSYNKIQWVGEGQYGPYVVAAQLRFPGGVIISAFGYADTRTRQSQMLAAIRTIRLRAP